MRSADIIQWNCEGLIPKKGELERLLTEKDPICVCLQETKLPYEAKCNFSGFKSFLRNLEVPDGGKAHGGVAVFIRKGVSAFSVKLDTPLQVRKSTFEGEWLSDFCLAYSNYEVFGYNSMEL